MKTKAFSLTTLGIVVAFVNQALGFSTFGPTRMHFQRISSLPNHEVCRKDRMSSSAHLRMMASGKSGSAIPLILCPAQFGVPKDYDVLVELLERRGFKTYVAPLSRGDWLKIVPSTNVRDYIAGELKPSSTLGFYYEAISEAMSLANAEHGDSCQVAFLGHSIGGWVARSYIGERMGADAVKRVRSLVTLGTPNNPPPQDSAVAALDQTRGLLTFINKNFPAGSPLDSSRVCCVAGSGTKVPDSLSEIFTNVGDKLWDDKVGRSTLVEQLVALASYLPLSGKALGVQGDGLIPVETALMPNCRSLVLDCNHAAFVPTPWDSLKLPESYVWYGSPSLIDEWVPYL